MKGKALKMKKWLSYIIPCAIIPAFVAAGMFIFKDKPVRHGYRFALLYCPVFRFFCIMRKKKTIQKK